jgi:uncharacterized delta-60 repeat protein
MFYSLKGTTLMSACLSARRALGRHARKFLILSLIVSLMTIGLQHQAQASDDSVLDSSFSRDGKLITNFDAPAHAQAVVIEPDGKIIAAGDRYSGKTYLDFALVRYNLDGSLDTTFGHRGTVATDLRASSSDDKANAVALQPDGKIVAAGDSLGLRQWDFALARYNPDGSLDTTFGDGGKVITDFGMTSTAQALAIQPNGKIVVAGIVGEYPTSDFALARYNRDGHLDLTFDGDGLVTTDFFNGIDVGRGLVLQPGGRVVVAGTVFNSGSGKYNIALARYTSDGSLDQAFGNGGKVTTDPFGYGAGASAITLQTDGKLVVAGGASASNFSGGFALVRYNRDGSLDPTFGNGGKVLTDFVDSNSGAHAVAFQPAGGKIVAVGWATHPHAGYQIDFAAARYNSNGSLDESFAVDGKTTTDFFCDDDSAFGVAIQPDNKVVAVGYSGAGSGPAFSLVRYPAQSAASPEPKLLSVTLTRSTTPGGQNLNLLGALTLNAPAPPGGLTVTLSDNIAAAYPPPSVWIPAGATSSCFVTIITPVNDTQVGNIVASLNGVSRSARLIVRPIAVSYMVFSPYPIVGPNTATGTVNLERPAPTGGLTVQLASRNPGVARPTQSSVYIPEGALYANFEIQTTDVPSPRSAIITATANGISKSAVLTVQ